MAQNLVEYVLDIQTKAAEQGLDDLASELEEVAKQLEEITSSGKKTGSGLFKSFADVKAGVDIAVQAFSKVKDVIVQVAKATFDVVKKVTDLTNELNDLSVRSGLSTKTIQGLRQALLSSGQPAEGLNEILGAISGQFAQLSMEGSSVEKKFKSFGIAVRDTNGNLRSNNDILLDGISLLQGISDSSERSRIAVTLFGEAGSKLNQALAAGEFEKFLSFTEKFGIKAGPEASKAASQFQVVLAGLNTVIGGTLQKLVNATDGQNRFINGMIELGSTIAFVGSLLDSFSKEINTLTNAFIDLLNFGIRQTIAILLGPFASALNIIMSTLNLLGIEIDLVGNALTTLTGFTVQTIDPQNRLGNALNKAKEEAQEYKDTMLSVGNSLNALPTDNATNGIVDLGKETKETTEVIRTFNDVLNDAFRKFTSFDVNKVVSDFQIVGNTLTSLFNKIKSDFNSLSTEIVVPENVFERLYRNVLIRTGNLVRIIQDKLEQLDNIETPKFQALSKGLNKAIQKSGMLLQKVGGKFGSVVSSGISAGAATAITGVLAVLSIAKKLGERGDSVKDIQKSVEQDIRAQAKAIELGLRALPRILFETLPPILIEFVDRLIFGIGKAIAELLNLIINGFKAIFTKDGLKNIGQSIKEGLKASFGEFLRRLNVLGGIVSKRGGGRIPSARGGIKFTGNQQGLALLHPNEFVVPESGQMPQAVERAMTKQSGSGINIVINASVVENNAIDELVRQIERRFQTFGSSTSPLFGGR